MLYLLFIYVICGYLYYIISAVWNVYFCYIRLGHLGNKTIGVFATWGLWSLQLNRILIAYIMKL